jgi:uncharacterized protein (DUF1800 family)
MQTTIQWLALAVLLASSSVAAQVANCPFNVDGTGTRADSLRDGVQMLRYAQGIRGRALVEETAAAGVDLDALATTVAQNIASREARLDVNGSGAFDVADATAIMRVLLGYNTGRLLPVTATATSDPRGAGKFAIRDTDAAVQLYLDGGCTSSAVSEQQEISRFLTQTTFGASKTDVIAFQSLAQDTAVSGSAVRRRASTWINAQMALPIGATHYDYINTPANGCGDLFDCRMGTNYARHSFWQQALTRNDQLRQRMAFALSQIFVVSTNSNINNHFQLASYMDLMHKHAFGNYRDLLEDVSRSPAMGVYLSHLRNNGASANPNENYAREVLQLFSIGLVQLENNGRPKAGNTPTYDEDVIRAFARVFTGMSYDDRRTAAQRCPSNANEVIPNYGWSPTSGCADVGFETSRFDMSAFARPMMMYDGYHSALEKRLLQYDTAAAASPDPRCSAARIDASKVLPAIAPEAGITRGTRVSKATADAMMSRAIDNIFCHPNVGPFISEQLIRFFVTSTPSPEYVARVTAVFNDSNGAASGGVRGDFKAVLRAILLDSEAIAPAALANADRERFGKLKEPMIRFTSIFRAFPEPNIAGLTGRRRIDNVSGLENGLSQGPYQSPTVFNFFHPEFSPPGPILNANAFGPEFEITTTTSIAGTQNFMGDVVTRRPPSASAYVDYGIRYPSTGSCQLDPNAAGGVVVNDCIFMNMSDLQAISLDSGAMIDYLNLVLMGGRLPESIKDSYVQALNAAYPVVDDPVRKRDRVRAAMWLAVQSPEFQIQY